MITRVHLFGSLRKKIKNQYHFPIELELKQPVPLTQLLETLNVPMDTVQLAMIDHKSASEDSIITPGCHLALFPKEYPVFADWKDNRL